MDYQVVSRNRANHLSIVDCPTAEWAVAIAEIDIRRGQFQHIIDSDGARLDLVAFKARRRPAPQLYWMTPTPYPLASAAPGAESAS